MAEYTIDFKKLKKEVGIDDVAYSLGYRLNKKAGVGKRFELVLGPIENPSDVIIIKNTPDKENQSFFRRDDTKGDVISFIMEKFDCKKSNGDINWLKVGNVLREFANMPPVEYNDRKAVEEAKTSPQIFDAERYEVQPLNKENHHWLLDKRGLSKSCVSDFGDNIVLIKDLKQKNFDGFNIGFPYKNPDTNEITGYEIRGGNSFKSKAAGTDSSHSFWFAEFGSTGSGITNVYLFESSFDAMAFYQLNKAKLALTPFSLVSMGGSFTHNQLEGIRKRFPSAKIWDCFDNDLAGQVFAKNLVAYIDKKPLDILYKTDERSEKLAVLTLGTKEIVKKADSFDFKQAAKELGLKYSIGHWKAPSNFKDWNDCLLGKQITQNYSESKYQRERNLAEKRKTNSFKL